MIRAVTETMPTHDELQPRFAANIRHAYHEAGEAWLARIPAVLREAAERWSLRLEPPFPALSYNYVAPVTRADGSPAVLKAGVPHRERTAEILALLTYDGDAMPRALEHDINLGVMLIERVFPGTPLVELKDDDEAARVAASIVRRGWRPVAPDHQLEPVTHWFRELKTLRAHVAAGTSPFSEYAVAQAQDLVRDLSASTETVMLIHGDFHHYNILSSGDGWMAIDPKGVVGDPSFDFAMFLMNPLDFRTWPDWEARIRRRVEIFGDAGFDQERIVGWLKAFAVLSNWWSIEGQHVYPPDRIAFVETIARLKL